MSVETKFVKKTSYKQEFSINYHVNQLLKDVEWKEHCYIPTMASRHLFEAIMDTYDLDECTVYDLVLSYRTYPSAITKTKKVVRIDRSDKDMILEGRVIREKEKGTSRPLTLADLTLHL